MAEYKIELGVKLDTSDIGSQIRKFSQNNAPKINLEFNKKGIDNQLDSIRKQIKNLGNIKIDLDGTGGTTNLTKPFVGLEESIREIKSILSSLGNNTGMDSVLGTVNKINTALESTSNEFKELSASLKSLASKDFSVNLDLKFGSGKNPVAANAAYGQKVRSETLPQLKSQLSELTNYLRQYYSAADEYAAISQLFTSTINNAGKSNIVDTDLIGFLNSFNSVNTGSLASQMTQHKNIIDQIVNMVKYTGNADLNTGINNITSGFSKSADDLINDAKRVQYGLDQTEKQAEETKQQLKNIFGSGIDSDALNAQLNSVVDNLNEIRASLQALASNDSLGGLTQSFENLSTTLREITRDISTFAQAVNTGLSGSGTGVNNISSNVSKEVKNVTNALKTAGEQGGKVLTDSLENAVESNLSLDDIIAKEAHAISSFLEFDKYLEPDKTESAIKEITAAISDYVTNVKVAIGNTEKLGDDIAYLARSNGINKIKDTILKNRSGSSTTSDIDQSYLDIYDYVKNYNKKGYKVNIPESIRQREDYNSMRRKLGAAFTSGAGTDLETFIQQLNEEKGEIIDLSKGIDSAFDQLYDAVQRGKNLVKSGKSSGGIDIIDDIPKNELSDVYALIEAALNNIEEFQQKVKEAASAVNSIGVSSEESGFEEMSTEAKQASQAIETVEDKLRKIANIDINLKDGIGIESLKQELRNLDFDESSIERVTKEFEEMRATIRKVSSNFNEKTGVVKLNIEGIDKAGKTVSAIKNISVNAESMALEVQNANQKASQSFNELARNAQKAKDGLKNSDIGVSKFEQEISRVKTAYKELSIESDSLINDLDALEGAFKNMELANAANDTERLTNSYIEYLDILKRVNAQLEANAKIQKEKFLRQDAVNLSIDMDNWLSDNSKAAKQFGAQIRSLQAELKSCNKVRFDEIKGEFKEIEKTAKRAGVNVQTFGDRLKTQFSKYSAYFGIAELFMYAEQGLQDMFEQVKLIDSAMTELKKVTDETDASYSRFLESAADRAKEIGTTIDGLVKSTADFARLGYGFEDAQGLAEVANIYAVVGDEVEGVEGATTSLISTMAAFKKEMNGMSNTDFSLNIVDKLNEVDKLAS